MKVGVWDRYWTTYGGGEQYAAAVALALAADHEVELLTPSPFDVDEMADRLGVDLAGLTQVVVGDELGIAEEPVVEATADYDLFVNATFLSVAPSHAGRSWYLTHFPELPVLGRRARFGLARRGEPAALRDASAATPSRLVFLDTYERVLANSAFTAGWVERRWGVPAEVLWPLVRPVAGRAKEPLIAAVGRFFPPGAGHSKHQVDLVRAFRRLSPDAPGWRLVLMGGCAPAHRDALMEVRREAVGLDVEVRPNVRRAEVEDLLGRAGVLWHGAGLGDDVTRRPELAEHFGIAVVEAMSAGAVPVVVGGAGPGETVVDGVSGRIVDDLDGFVAATRELVDHAGVRERLAAGARRRAADFGPGPFSARMGGLLTAPAP